MATISLRFGKKEPIYSGWMIVLCLMLCWLNALEEDWLEMMPPFLGACLYAQLWVAEREAYFLKILSCALLAKIDADNA
jgi:CHASE2 domain-containing sensor protein